MKRFFLVGIIFVTHLFPIHASADDAQARGAQILDMQLQRARHLKELEYQAEVLERQARIAKAQQQIDKTTGLEFVGNSSSQVVSQPSPSVKRRPLPSIVELTGTSVTFEFAKGQSGVYRVGDQLPSGHRLEAISMVTGATLSSGSNRYQVNFNW